jgi:multidrug efflux pump subunit AcrA (membrane-fusion protein)
MSLTARVPTSQQRERLTIHNDAIRRDDAGAFVYVARPIGARGGEPESGGPSHVADAVRIDPLFAIGERAAIRGGALEPGALVLTIGNERTTPGQPLIIVGRERDRSEDRGGPGPDAADDGVAGDKRAAGDG